MSGDNTKTGEKRARDDTVMTYREFFPGELKRIKLENPSMSHKVAFKQAGLNWRTSPLNPKSKAVSASKASVPAAPVPAASTSVPAAPVPAATTTSVVSTETLPVSEPSAQMDKEVPKVATATTLASENATEKEQSATVPAPTNANSSSASFAKATDVKVPSIVEKKDVGPLDVKEAKQPIEKPSLLPISSVSFGYVKPAPPTNATSYYSSTVGASSVMKQVAPDNAATSLPAPANTQSFEQTIAPAAPDMLRPAQKVDGADSTKKQDTSGSGSTASVGKIPSMAAHTVPGTIAAAK